MDLIPDATDNISFGKCAYCENLVNDELDTCAQCGRYLGRGSSVHASVNIDTPDLMSFIIFEVRFPGRLGCNLVSFR